MPNERLTTDYVEGWEAGAEAVHERLVADLRPLFMDMMDTYPQTKGVLTGIYSFLYGMPLPAPRRSEGGTFRDEVEPQKVRDSGWDPESHD